MLDLNSPRTKIIFKASSYTDKLKNCCGKYTIENFQKRQDIFIKMLLICDEFEQFYNINYSDNQWEVKVILDNIKKEIENLSVVDIETESNNCKVCNGKLFIHKSAIKEFGTFYYCSKCPNIIVEKLNELESLTGAIFI